MPPPRHRDRGFSRRISNGLFIGYVVVAVGIVGAGLMLLVQRYDPIAFQGIRGLALDIGSPVSGLTRGIARGADDVGQHVGAYFDAIDRNVALRATLEADRHALIAARSIERENQRLKGLLHLVENGARPIVTARIVGSSFLSQRRYATLSAGTVQGVRAGQPVRDPDGLIGRIAEAGHGWSRVELLTDVASSVPVRSAGTGQQALAVGRGDGTLDIRSTQTGAAPLRRGDVLVTSGTGGVYPVDIPVAVVTGVSGEVARARPLAPIDGLDLAIVLPEAPSAPPPAPGGR